MAVWTVPGLTVNKGSLPANSRVQFGGGRPIQTVVQRPPSRGVLGANTQRSLGVQPALPSSGGGYQQPQQQPPMLESYPEPPSFDETPFNDIIAGIDQLGTAFTSGFETASKGIEQRGQSQITDLEGQKAEAEQGLQEYRTQAEQDATKNIAEQRRQFSEVQQGLQARYGGSTGTGGFVSELAGRQTLGNIANFRQQLQGEFSKAQNMQNNLLRTYISEKTKIENSTKQLIEDARSGLNQQIAELGIRKGQVNVDKAARRDALLGQYQSAVRDIQARNTAYLRDLDERKNAVQNSLQAQSYKMTYNAMQKAMGFWQDAALSGGLTPQGYREAESAWGFAPNTLQAPVKATTKKDDENARLEKSLGLPPGTLSG